jgi:acetyl esterase/lipase
MDAQRSMGLVREMAAAGKVSGLNASKIGFMGFSAGAHLTGHLNVVWQNRTYSHVDGADVLPCRPDFSMMVYPWDSVRTAFTHPALFFFFFLLLFFLFPSS